MMWRGQIVVALAAISVAAGVAWPSSASAHAYLIRATPAPSGVLNAPPPSVQLTYDEPVEPKFAIISVTNSAGQQQTAGPVRRSAANPDTLVVPLRPHLPEGWYLLYWRAISVDGHPVQGAFTYAVGPNPGPAPQFPVPSIAGSATSLHLLIARWVMFLSVMSAIGLFAFRSLIARPIATRARGTRLRAVSRACVIASVVGLLAIPAYLDFATATDSLRSVFDVGALVPLFRVTAFGRGYVDMLVCFALFCVAAWISLWLDQPDRVQRSVAGLVALTGSLLAAAAVLLMPGASGHASQTSPRGISVILDWLHLITGSVWLGGLIGLLVLWSSLPRGSRVAGLSVVVPRFSKVALVAVSLLLATGAWATVNHMPTLNSLWLTGYGVAILVKTGLLVAAMTLAAGNLLRTTPRLAAAQERPEPAEPAAGLLRRLISGEAVLITGAVFAAAVLSSLGPPPPAFALQSSALATVGPGRVAATVEQGGYALQVLVSPNKAAAPDTFALRISKHGQPVRGANVTLTFNHTEMQMPQQEYQLTETQPGVYSHAAPALVMVGKWALAFHITPTSGPSITALILDQANG
jgi:copper transport protein